MTFTLRRFAPAALLILAACSPQSPAPAAPAPAAAPTDAPASPAEASESSLPERPRLRVTTFDGGQYDLAARRGRWVVVNYWATWCNPCLKEIPDLDAMDRAREDVEVIGLAYEEIERADMEAFLRTHPISYPIAIIDTYSPPVDFGTPRGLPMTFLIDPDGKVAARHLGPVTSQDLLREIDRRGPAPAG